MESIGVKVGWLENRWRWWLFGRKGRALVTALEAGASQQRTYQTSQIGKTIRTCDWSVTRVLSQATRRKQ